MRLIVHLNVTPPSPLPKFYSRVPCGLFTSAPMAAATCVSATASATAISEGESPCTIAHAPWPVRRARSVARRSPVLAAAWSQLGLGLLVRGVCRGGALLDIERLVGLVDACAIVSRAAQLIVSSSRSTYSK